MTKRKLLILISMMRLKSKILVCLAAWSFSAAFSLAQTVLEELNVDVELQDNGDAIITETRKADVDSRNTECYIVIGNLNGSEITDLKVTDDKGVEYVNIGEWDSDVPKAEKNGKCGIIYKSDGYELCWGLGNDDGERVYYTSYRVTNLLKAYNDFDGFNYMFIAKDLQPSPEDARVVIRQKDRLWTQEEVKMWAFGFDGEVNYEEGTVVAHPLGSLDGNPMIIMIQLNKDVIHPQTVIDDSFETVKQRAFEGSDYPESKPKSFIETIKEEPSILLVILACLCPFILLIVKWIRVFRLKRAANKNLMWYRDLPYNGNLQKANAVLNAMKYGKNDYKSLVSAAAVRLISIGALRIEEHFVEPTGFAKIIGKQGKYMKLIVIGELEEKRNLPVTKMLRMLYELFRDASGDDLILQPNEFKRFVKNNVSRLKEFMEEVMYKTSIKKCYNDMDNVKAVLGLKKYLNDFTLANERGVQEVGLWGDYLVYAELFGCADQLRKEMRQINPEFLNMDDMYKALFDDDLVREVTYLALFSASTGSNAISADRAGGSGGFSSIGGGGGFSGGGSGGGFR